LKPTGHPLDNTLDGNALDGHALGNALDSRAIWEALPGLPLLAREPLCGHTTFRIGGPADLLAMPRSREELAGLQALAHEAGMPVSLMGGGANLLVSDKGVRGLVVKTRPGLSDIRRRGDDGQGADGIIAGAGALLSHVAAAAAVWGLGGLSFAYGIPGTVGGAIVMNAGAYGGEMSQVVDSADVLTPDGMPFSLPAGDLAFSYRRSYFTDNPGVTVTAAAFRLAPGDPASLRREMDALSQRRRASQPLEYPSGGSVFKRPAGHYAGRLIADCGLKGYRIGGAQVSEKHAGFIVNRGGATCEDVKRLIAHIQETVAAQTGVVLECELKFMGE